VPPPGALVIAVTGQLWWWEVRYRDPATAAEIRTANEIRIPAGRPVYLALDSADVIHSFWVPQLAGKIDMIPGRQQHLLLSADRPGIYRGQCAEFCGAQHARMALHVVALAPAEFDAWLAAQARPALAAGTPRQQAGQQAFVAHRCDACHTVRGVTGSSRLGPDLTHVGSRLHLAAGTLANSQQGRLEWIAQVQRIKSGARMPSYERLGDDTLGAIAEWLGTLE
jgi:cytochrome c oxidase subunit 2